MDFYTEINKMTIAVKLRKWVKIIYRNNLTVHFMLNPLLKKNTEVLCTHLPDIQITIYIPELLKWLITPRIFYHMCKKKKPHWPGEQREIGSILRMSTITDILKSSKKKKGLSTR